jgi:aminopeptidase N
MKNIPIAQKREIVLKVLSREKHEGILNEALSQLAFDSNSNTIALMKNLFGHQKAAVREQVLRCLEPNEINKALFEKALIDSSYEVAKTALEKLCNAFPILSSKYLDQTRSIIGMNHSVEIKRLELSIINQINEIEAKNNLVFLASENYEFRTRILAFQALKSTQTFNEQVIHNLFQAMLSSNSRLANPAFELLNHFSTSIEFRSRMKNFYKNQNYSESQREILLKNVFLQVK